jgi:hypothetical protein
MSACPLSSGIAFPPPGYTAQWAGLKGKSNGELVAAAELAGYDALLTVDQGIPRQQPSGRRKLAIIVIRAKTNQMEDLSPLVGAILDALQSLEPGAIIRIPRPA